MQRQLAVNVAHMVEGRHVTSHRAPGSCLRGIERCFVCARRAPGLPGVGVKLPWAALGWL